MFITQSLRALLIGALIGLYASISIALAAVNLNTASQAELEALPGVGKKQATEIMAKRPFKSVDDLKEVKGIGDKKFAKLAPLVTVDNASTTAASASNNAATTTANAANTVGTTAGNAASNAATTTGNAANSAAAQASAAANGAANGIGNAATTAGNRMDEQAQKTQAHAAKKAPMAAGERVNLNTATADQLARLPGIGPAKAQAIIAGRPYATPEDVMKVKGIKQGVFNKIKDHVST